MKGKNYAYGLTAQTAQYNSPAYKAEVERLRKKHAEQAEGQVICGTSLRHIPAEREVWWQ